MYIWFFSSEIKRKIQQDPFTHFVYTFKSDQVLAYLTSSPHSGGVLLKIDKCIDMSHHYRIIEDILDSSVIQISTFIIERWQPLFIISTGMIPVALRVSLHLILWVKRQNYKLGFVCVRYDIFNRNRIMLVFACVFVLSSRCPAFVRFGTRVSKERKFILIQTCTLFDFRHTLRFACYSV